MVEIGGDDDGFGGADDFGARDETEEARIAAVVAVVAHHEVVAGGHADGAEVAEGRAAGQSHDGVGAGAELFAGEDGGGALGGLEVAGAGGGRGEGGVGGRLAVDDELVTVEFDHVAREADDAFHETGAVVGGETHDDIAARGIGPAGEARRGERHAEIVGEFVDEDDVAAEDRGLHGAGRDVVDVGEGGFGARDEEKREGERADPVAPEDSGTGFGVHRRRLRRGGSEAEADWMGGAGGGPGGEEKLAKARARATLTGTPMNAPPRFFRLAALLAATVAAALAQAPRPNVVFILADDLGYGELGSYGQKIIRTPHLDRLAAEGMRFTQFYAGNTVCAPSRSVLMTGQHMGHTRVRGNAGAENPAAQTLRAGDVTVARVLQGAGYATGLVGKWGLGNAGEEGEPQRQGFDYCYGFLNQTHAHNHFPDFLWRNGERVALPNDITRVGPIEGVGYATKRVAYADDLFFDEARDFIERSKDQPFFLYLALTAPHANNERARILGDGQEVPSYGPYADQPWPDAQKGQAAMITRMDARIGDLLAQLKKLGLDERTLVIFTSDNGPHREGGPLQNPDFFAASGPLSGSKRALTEGGIRVPFIARWPGKIKAGAVSAHVGYFGDMMATLAELSGATAPKILDSISVVPELLGRGKQPAHDTLYWEFYEKGFSQAVLLGGRWKGIRLLAPDAPIQLFDLKNDLGEKTDLAIKQPERVARMAEIMRTAHVDNDYWKMPVK